MTNLQQALGLLLFVFVTGAGLSQILGWFGWPDVLYCPVMGVVRWATPVFSFLLIACCVISAVNVAQRRFQAAGTYVLMAALFGSLPHITHYVFYAGGTHCLG